jgi:hypothetical protein
MFAVVRRDPDGRIALQTAQPEQGDASWYRDYYQRRFRIGEFVVCPFPSFIDETRSSGSNPIRADFDFDQWA